MATVIISDQMVQPYSEFITETLTGFGNVGVSKIAVVGITDNGTTLTGHFAMDTTDVAVAAQHLQFDAIDMFIRANLGRYREMDDEED